MSDDVSGTVHGWVWRSNLMPFLKMASEFVRYRFDSQDERAIFTGLVNTDPDADLWFDYRLAGELVVPLRLASADDCVLIEIELDGLTERFDTQMAVLLNVFSVYRMLP
jgi:hypothetical protein